MRLNELRVVRHEPDNRFVECAVAATVDFVPVLSHIDREDKISQGRGIGKSHSL
jgi:hypothetical protein